MWANLTRGHVWGDDFAGYINQGHAILGNETQEFIEKNKQINQLSMIPPGPDAYPWGYPLLLTPIIALFGVSVMGLKLVNLLFWVVILFSVFGFSRQRVDFYLSLLITSLLAFSPLFIEMNDLIQSDIPFLGVVYLFLWLEGSKKESYLYNILSGALLFCAIFLRTHGILLIFFLLPRVITGTSRKREFIQLVLILFIAGFLYVTQYLVFPSGESSYLSHFEMFAWKNLWQNTVYYFWSFSEFFGTFPAGGLIFILFLALFLVAQKQAFRSDLGIQTFFFLSYLVFILWPERQGARFLLPLIPIFLVRTGEGIMVLTAYLPNFKKVAQFALLLLTIFFFYFGMVSGFRNISVERNINGPFDLYSNAAFNAVRKMTAEDAVIVFFKPRALYLFTHRLSYTQNHCEGLENGDYVLIHKKQADNLQIEPTSIQECSQVESTPIYSNKRFVLYKIR